MGIWHMHDLLISLIASDDNKRNSKRSRKGIGQEAYGKGKKHTRARHIPTGVFFFRLT